VGGINWKTVGKATFDKIAEILLRGESGFEATPSTDAAGTEASTTT
jgi:hypothetical protein